MCLAHECETFEGSSLQHEHLLPLTAFLAGTDHRGIAVDTAPAGEELEGHRPGSKVDDYTAVL